MTPTKFREKMKERSGVEWETCSDYDNFVVIEAIKISSKEEMGQKSMKCNLT